MTEVPVIDHGLRLAALWGAWLLLMLFHVELGLMPLFHGLTAEIESQVPLERLPQLFWAMLIYVLLPLGSMLLVVHAISAPSGWSASTSWRAAQFWFSAVYSLSNALHLLADLRIPDSRSDQVALMAVLTVIGVLINLEAWRWWQG
ncbi:MAG: hypothetical protein FJ077_04570 [Cyanobacteria bacterium K_DeepCast_35m_m2_023]|nr:hypothetical protein [Cyanobacteria bacterium K_DeepCast_35m_m2_023]